MPRIMASSTSASSALGALEGTMIGSQGLLRHSAGLKKTSGTFGGAKFSSACFERYCQPNVGLAAWDKFNLQRDP